MCGFFGHFNTNQLPRQKFEELLSLSNHRGPDNSGYYSNNSVQIGFNRLSIQDLKETGNQPMISPGGRYVVVFNGEVYNHNGLRRTLSQTSYRSSGDTETIVHLLENFGIKSTIERLDGMFAIVVYDTLNETIHLARDFAGIKPLFYGQVGSQLVFSSQYDQLIAHPLLKNSRVNERVLKLYLKQHYIPAPFGLKENTFQVRPGEIVTVNSNGKKLESSYWSFPEVSSNELIKDQNKALQVIEESLNKSVQNQLLADVPIGSFLSGGVDSPIICAYAKQHNNAISAYTIGSDSAKHDETDFAVSIAESIQVNQKTWKVDESEALKFWNETMQCIHEPLADFSILPTYLVSKLARRNVTVALSGDGGDELFFGYERFNSLSKNRSLSELPLLIRKGLYSIDKAVSGNKLINSLTTLSSQKEAHEMLHSRFTDRWIKRIAPGLMDVPYPDEWAVYNFEDSTDLRTLLTNMRKAEFYGMMQKTLRKVDLASMQNSLEVRVPFLQKEVIEASTRIDPLLSFGNGQLKQLLKQVFVNKTSLMPEKVKKGFTIPLKNWIQGSLKSTFQEQLSSYAKNTDWIEESALSAMFNHHIKNEEDYKWPLFTLYALSKI